jgi:PAS domain S-box-containing protein
LWLLVVLDRSRGEVDRDHRGASSAPAGEAGFRLLTQHLPDLALLAFDLDLRIWSATGAALRAAGWGPEEFLGQRVPDVGRPDDAVIVEAYCRAALAGECRQLETTGKTYPYRLWAKLFVPLPDERGALVGGMTIARDITDQRRAERQLLASRRRLAEAQRIAHLGSWELDLETDELTISDEMAQIVGLPPGTSLLIEPGVDQFVHPADRAEVLARLGRMRTDPSPFCFEHRFVRTDGVTRTVMARGEGVVDEHGRVVRFIGTEQSLAAIGFKLEQARLRPLVLVEDGLEAALREEAKSACNRAALVACEVTSELDGRLDPVVETALFRVAQQTLANVVDHAKAAHVQVIGDIAHFGLIAMRERVEALGGRFRVTTAPGQGTVVEARLPLTDPAEWRWGA